METLKDVFKRQIGELYAIEYQLLKILPVIVNFSDSPKFRKKLRYHLDETVLHIRRIEVICNDLGISPNEDSSEVMLQMVYDVRRLIQGNMHIGVKDSALLGQIERMEHYEIASYKSALEHAKKMGAKDYIELLERTLNEEYEAEERLSSLRDKKHGPNHLRVT